MKDNKKNKRRQIDDMEICAFKFEDPKKVTGTHRTESLSKAIQRRTKMFTNSISQHSNFKWSWTRGAKKKCIQICIDDVTQSQHAIRIHPKVQLRTWPSSAPKKKKKTNCISRALHCMWNLIKIGALGAERSYRRKQCRHTRTTFVLSTPPISEAFFCALATACNVYNRSIHTIQTCSSNGTLARFNWLAAGEWHATMERNGICVVTMETNRDVTDGNVSTIHVNDVVAGWY